VLTPALATAGDHSKDNQKRLTLAFAVAKQVLTHPFIIATILGALASYARWSPPGGLGTILEMLKVSAGPCALFALGATVGLRKFGGIGRELPLLVLIKLMLQPLLALSVLRLVPGLDPVWYHVAIMMAGLPTASNAFIFARQYGSFIEGTSTAVIITTMISALTLPFLIFVMQTGWF
jgi:predicted permease